MEEISTAEEVAYDLLSRKQQVKMLDRTLRNQGASRYIAMTKTLPKRFHFVRVFKLGEFKNAVLVLILDPTMEGYNAQAGTNQDGD